MREDEAVLEVEPRSQVRTQHSRRARLCSDQTRRSSASRPVGLVNSNCFVCGLYNPSGLHLTFERGPNGVEAEWTPNEAWESFQGTVHGGIITTVLDEAMSKAIIASGWQAFTAELKVRFHGRTSPGERLRVHGWVIERRKRRILAEARLVTEVETERAHGWATFLVPRNRSLS